MICFHYISKQHTYKYNQQLNYKQCYMPKHLYALQRIYVMRWRMKTYIPHYIYTPYTRKPTNSSSRQGISCNNMRERRRINTRIFRKALNISSFTKWCGFLLCIHITAKSAPLYKAPLLRGVRVRIWWAIYEYIYCITLCMCKCMLRHTHARVLHIYAYDA